MTLDPDGNGGAVVAAGPGGLCRKGWTSADLLTGAGRLASPLVRAVGVPVDAVRVRGDVVQVAVCGQVRLPA